MKGDPGFDENKKAELNELVKLVEENQFVAHANSILETEKVTDKVLLVVLIRSKDIKK